MKKRKWNIRFRLGVLLLALFVSLGILSACGKLVQTPKDSLTAEATIDLMPSREEAETESDTDPPVESFKETSTEKSFTGQGQNSGLDEEGTYTSKEDVADYLHEFGHLPDNFITKKEANKLGWSGGSLEQYAPGKCIGGDYFGNYEGLLPTKKGRKYYECDIDTLGKKKRGAKRIIFSNDGLIYYTGDHYESYELLYGTP